LLALILIQFKLVRVAILQVDGARRLSGAVGDLEADDEWIGPVVLGRDMKREQNRQSRYVQLNLLGRDSVFEFLGAARRLGSLALLALRFLPVV